jgi:hypothetical protein
VLVLAPLRVARDTWPEEARKWNHLRHVSVMPIVGSESERRAALKYDASVYTTNYENVEWLVEFYGERWPFRTSWPTSSTKLKSFRLRQGGKRAAALAKVAHPKVKRFIELTGTPSPTACRTCGARRGSSTAACAWAAPSTPSASAGSRSRTTATAWTPLPTPRPRSRTSCATSA